MVQASAVCTSTMDALTNQLADLSANQPQVTSCLYSGTFDLPQIWGPETQASSSLSVRQFPGG